MICTAHGILFKARNGKGRYGGRGRGWYWARMRENVCIQGFVGEGSYLEELGIDGTKVLKLIFQKQVVVESF